MKNRVLRFANWTERHWLALTALGGLFLVAQIVFMVDLAIVENVLNGVYEMKFDVAGLWNGMKVIYGGFIPLCTLAFAGWGKHHNDSKFNTVQGQNPDSIKDKGE